MTDKNGITRALYVHIPFCERRCGYCDFRTFAGYGEDFMRRYCSYVVREIRMYAEHAPDVDAPVTSLYVGGGTPSFAPPDCIADIVETVRSAFAISDDAEITVEVNPASALRERLDMYRAAGVNRLSVGVQSFDPGELTFLERIHTVEDAVRTIEDARAAGFANIGIDLIYGIPGQSPARWEQTLKEAAALRPEHISAYSLTVEPGTPLAEKVASGAVTMPEDDEVFDLFKIVHEFLAEKGYEHYEVSNYARAGFRSRHNSRYWSRLPYRGFGLAAHSYEPFRRSWNTPDLTDYCTLIDAGKPPEAGSEILTPEQRRNEAVMLSLRTADGLDLQSFEAEFGSAAAGRLRPALAALADDTETAAYVMQSGSTWSLTPAGLFLSDGIISRLME